MGSRWTHSNIQWQFCESIPKTQYSRRDWHITESPNPFPDNKPSYSRAITSQCNKHRILLDGINKLLFNQEKGGAASRTEKKCTQQSGYIGNAHALYAWHQRGGKLGTLVYAEKMAGPMPRSRAHTLSHTYRATITVSSPSIPLAHVVQCRI